MPLRAALFDVGDTLVEHWAPREQLNALLRVAVRRDFGERAWAEEWIKAKIGPRRLAMSQTEIVQPQDEQSLRQETLRWYRDWFAHAKVDAGDIDVDRLRTTMCIPLDLVSTPVPGALTALRWCKRRGLAVVLVTNTLSRGDAEVWEDWRRFGVADAIDGVVSSHSIGWQKPHRRIFERALELAAARPEDAVMIGDRLDADVLGASRLGMRTVLRRPTQPQPKVAVRPDAVIDDLTELPAVLTAWLDVPTAQQFTRDGASSAP